MIIRPGVVGVGVALVLALSGCSERQGPSEGQTGSTGQASTEQAEENEPTETTVDLTLDGQSVDLSGATLKCYDYEGHLMVEAHSADDPDASHFLMDYHDDKVALSLGVEGGESGVYEYEEGTDGQSAEVTHDGNSVSVEGTIGADGGEPQKFTIDANCAEFHNTPPDSSKVGASDMPSIPSTCPDGQVICYSGGKLR